MLSVYLDESFGSAPVWVMAGLVASPRQWERLTRDWGAVLRSVNLTDFHATDCANGGGAFRGWPKTDRDRLFVRLINLTRRAASFRIWTAVDTDDYRSSRFYEDKERFIYTLAALGCASRLKAIAARRPGDYRIPCVFDQGHKGKWAFKMFSDLAEEGRASWFGMGAITRADRRMTPPLQAADLHAYEVYRYFGDRKLAAPRGPRRSFRELLAIADGGGYFLTGRKLEMLAQGVIRQRAEGTGAAPIEVPVDHLEIARFSRRVSDGGS